MACWNGDGMRQENSAGLQAMSGRASWAKHFTLFLLNEPSATYGIRYLLKILCYVQENLDFHLHSHWTADKAFISPRGQQSCTSNRKPEGGSWWMLTQQQTWGYKKHWEATFVNNAGIPNQICRLKKNTALVPFLDGKDTKPRSLFWACGHIINTVYDLLGVFWFRKCKGTAALV